MTKRHASLVLTTLALAAPSFAQGPLPPPPTPAGNPTTAEKAVLGKLLFWDEQLSSDGTMACGTCHIPGSGGGDPRIGLAPAHPGADGVLGTPDDVFGSPGMRRSNMFGHYQSDTTFEFGEQATGRNSPSMIAAAYFPDLFWDGRATREFRDPLTGAVVLPQGGALESQSLAPIVSDVEMAWEGRSWTSVTDRLAAAVPMALATDLTPDMDAALAASGTYPELFQNAFGTNEITPVRIAFALAAYERTLIPDQSKFDQVMRGQAQFTQQEQRGFNLFRSPAARCDQCHVGSLFSDRQYHNLGLRPIGEDQGRQDVTGLFGDRGRFKTPTLRNVALRERFFHTGAPGIDSLRDVVDFYGQGGGAFGQNKDPLLNGIFVPPPVRNDLVTFLGTLTDPRVANETAPFDRPSLWSERAIANPAYLGFGSTPGSGGATPQIIAVVPPKEGNDGFRVGVHAAYGGSFAVLHVNLVTIPGTATVADLRAGLPLAQVLEGIGAGGGYGTWIEPNATVPALVGLTYDAQWWIRDAQAPQGVSRSNFVRITIE